MAQQVEGVLKHDKTIPQRELETNETREKLFHATDDDDSYARTVSAVSTERQ